MLALTGGDGKIKLILLTQEYKDMCAPISIQHWGSNPCVSRQSARFRAVAQRSDTGKAVLAAWGCTSIPPCTSPPCTPPLRSPVLPLSVFLINLVMSVALPCSANSSGWCFKAGQSSGQDWARGGDVGLLGAKAEVKEGPGKQLWTLRTRSFYMHR